MKRPLMIAGTGLLVFLYFLSASENSLFIPLFIFGICLTVFALLLNKRAIFPAALLLSAVCGIAFLLCSHMQKVSFEPAKNLYGKTVEVVGTAEDFCDSQWGKGSVVLKNCSFFGVKTNSRVTIKLPTGFSCAYGDTISSRVTVFSGEKELSDLCDKTFLSGEAQYCTRIKQGNKNNPIYRAKLFRKTLSEMLFENMSPDTAPVASALLLGDKNGMSTDFPLKLTLSGASHIFAVSGMHLTLWSGVIFALLRKRSRSKILPNAFASLFVLFYMALTGFSPSVIRAGIMLITVYLGFCFRRPADGLNSLGLSALILLTANPGAACDVSFLLSYSSTAALFTVYPLFERRYFSRHISVTKYFSPKKFAVFTANTLLLSLSVLLFTVPVCARYFGGVSLLSPVSSLLCTLPAEGIMLASAVALAFSPLPFLSKGLFRVCEFMCKLIIETVTCLSGFEFAYCEINKTLTFCWYIFSAAVILAVYFAGGKNRLKTLTASLLCALTIVPLGLICNRAEAKQISITAFSGNAAGNLLIHSDLGATAVMLCNGENTRGIYEIENLANVKCIKDLDLMIVPRDKSKARGVAKALEKSIKINEKAGYYADSLPVKDFTCRIKDNAQYTHFSRYNCGKLVCSQVDAVFVFGEHTDFSTLPMELTGADILICYKKLPHALNPGNFGKIILITQDSQLNLPENAISTALNGTTNIKISTKEKRYACY